MPRRSKRMWSIMPVSSGPCSSPGFMKPTNFQVPPRPSCLPAFLLALSHPALWLQTTTEGRDGLSQTPVSPAPPVGLLAHSRSTSVGWLLSPHSLGA